VASVWIKTRRTKAGGSRYKVEYRPGGRDTPSVFAGSFRTKRLAILRAAFIERELSDGRLPDLTFTPQTAIAPPTFAEAAKRWQDSRVDVSAGTKTQQRTSINRAIRILGTKHIDELTAHDIATMIAALVADGAKPSYVRKVVQATAMLFDHAQVSPNPARDKTIVKMPREEPEEINPPSAVHIEAIYNLIPSKHRLPLLWLDWSGARVASIDHTLVSDYDEQRQRVRLRAATTKTRRALWIDLHPVLAEQLEAKIGPREDRDPDARLFEGSGSDALRTSIAKACKAAAVPLFSPHDLRHRRISLMHLRGIPWARIGEFVGQRNLAVTANTYSHVLADETELDYAPTLCGRVRQPFPKADTHSVVLVQKVPHLRGPHRVRTESQISLESHKPNCLTMRFWLSDVPLHTPSGIRT
jgi:integrase